MALGSRCMEATVLLSVPWPTLPDSGLVLGVDAALPQARRNCGSQPGACLLQCSERGWASLMPGRDNSGSETGLPAILATSCFLCLTHILATFTLLMQTITKLQSFGISYSEKENLSKSSEETDGLWYPLFRQEVEIWLFFSSRITCLSQFVWVNLKQSRFPHTPSLDWPDSIMMDGDLFLPTTERSWSICSPNPFSSGWVQLEHFTLFYF